MVNIKGRIIFLKMITDKLKYKTQNLNLETKTFIVSLQLN